MKARALSILGILAWLVAPALAGAQGYDTTTASIVCTTLIGTIIPKPTLSLTEKPTVLSLKGTLGGCTVTGAIPPNPTDPPLQVVSGKVTAKLAVTGDASCATLVQVEGFQVTGSLVFKWKAAKGQALDSDTTTFTPDSGGLVPGLVPLDSTTYSDATIYGSFGATGTLGAGSAFAGGTPTFWIVSAEDIYNMLGQCCTDPMSCSPVGTGIKKLHVAIGQIRM